MYTCWCEFYCGQDRLIEYQVLLTVVHSTFTVHFRQSLLFCCPTGTYPMPPPTKKAASGRKAPFDPSRKCHQSSAIPHPTSSAYLSSPNKHDIYPVVVVTVEGNCSRTRPMLDVSRRIAHADRLERMRETECTRLWVSGSGRTAYGKA